MVVPQGVMSLFDEFIVSICQAIFLAIHVERGNVTLHVPGRKRKINMWTGVVHFWPQIRQYVDKIAIYKPIWWKFPLIALSA